MASKAQPPNADQNGGDVRLRGSVSLLTVLVPALAEVPGRWLSAGSDGRPVRRLRRKLVLRPSTDRIANCDALDAGMVRRRAWTSIGPCLSLRRRREARV